MCIFLSLICSHVTTRCKQCILSGSWLENKIETSLVGCHTVTPLCLILKWGNCTKQYHITQLQRHYTESSRDPELGAVPYRWNYSAQEGAESLVNEFQWTLLLDLLAKDWFLELEAVCLWSCSLLPHSLLRIEGEHRRKKKKSALVIFILLLKDHICSFSAT